jgi:hypothetical protein
MYTGGTKASSTVLSYHEFLLWNIVARLGSRITQDLLAAPAQPASEENVELGGDDGAGRVNVSCPYVCHVGQPTSE